MPRNSIAEGASGLVFNTPSSKLIPLPDFGDQGSSITVHDAWNAWNSTLRDLDAWHIGLIANREDKSIKTNYGTWAGKWFLKYRYYGEIVVDVKRRLVLNDGLSVEDIIERLEFIRLSSIRFQSIRGLIDGLRSERDLEPFINRSVAIDISGELAEQFDGYNTADRESESVNDDEQLNSFLL
jgi:hypothetical protein